MFESDKQAYAMLSIQEHRTIGEINALVTAIYYVLGKQKYETIRDKADELIKLLEKELP